jgi:hypothetical protein
MIAMETLTMKLNPLLVGLDQPKPLLMVPRVVKRVSNIVLMANGVHAMVKHYLMWKRVMKEMMTATVWWTT